jgi:hypothetical protein
VSIGISGSISYSLVDFLNSQVHLEHSDANYHFADSPDSPHCISEMAVLPSLPGIEVTVCVNKVPLKEYFDDEPSENPGRHRDSLAPRIVSKYIEAITDQEFTLHFRVAKPYDVDSPSLVFSTSVDGKNISSTLFRLSKHESITPLEKDTLGVKSYNSETGKSTFQALKFSRISTSK